jgi:hypothetical protein
MEISGETEQKSEIAIHDVAFDPIRPSLLSVIGHGKCMLAKPLNFHYGDLLVEEGYTF